LIIIQLIEFYIISKPICRREILVEKVNIILVIIINLFLVVKVHLILVRKRNIVNSVLHHTPPLENPRVFFVLCHARLLRRKILGEIYVDSTKT
jgi:hypothetical protein